MTTRADSRLRRLGRLFSTGGLSLVFERYRHNRYCSASGWPCPIHCEEWLK